MKYLAWLALPALVLVLVVLATNSFEVYALLKFLPIFSPVP
jgi:hypothetical protein